MIVDEIKVKTIPGFSNYAISQDGRVWSKPHIRKHPPYNVDRLYKGKWLRGYKHKSGYPHILLSRNGRRFLLKLSRLILKTFVGPCPVGMECRHLDGNKQNNQLSNLCWGTHQKNIDDRTNMGTTARGERQGLSKLKKQDVQNIRMLYQTNRFRYKDLASKFNVSISTIWQIIKGVTWTHLKTT